jgi:hypothetical protein
MIVQLHKGKRSNYQKSGIANITVDNRYRLVVHQEKW